MTFRLYSDSPTPHIRQICYLFLSSGLLSIYSKRVGATAGGHSHHRHHSYDHITSDFMASPRALSVGTADVLRSVADICENCLAA
jgi:hypothetical protein